MQRDKASKYAVFCCAGTPPKSREDVEGFPEKIPRKYLSRCVQLIPIKVIVLVVFAAYIGVSIWGAINLKQGLVIKDLVSEDSYYYKYRTWQENYFTDALPVSFVVDQTYEYSKSQTQTYLENIIANAQDDGFILNDTQISWFKDYKVSSFYNDSSETAFVNGLSLFLNDPRYSRFTNDVVISGNSITASRVYVFTNKIDSSQDDAQMMLNMRQVAYNSPLSATAFSPAFIFYEQYIAILPQTLQTLGISVAAVFLITAIFMPHPLLLLYVIVTMAMIMVGIIGFMTFWNLTLSSITMIHLIMSVGFSVDFTAHICHAYMVANGDNRNERVAEAMTSSGGPIFNGAVSSVLGILMLAFAKSYIFKSFFQVMLLVVLFGAAHALLFLPVLLSLVGPSKPKERSHSPKIGPYIKEHTREHSMNEITHAKSSDSRKFSQALKNQGPEIDPRTGITKRLGSGSSRGSIDKQSELIPVPFKIPRPHVLMNINTVD